MPEPRRPRRRRSPPPHLTRSGVFTNLLAGLAGARWGIKATLLAGLSLQLAGIGALFGWQESWAAEEGGKIKAILFVTCTQALCGVAKDLTKLGGKTARRSAPYPLFLSFFCFFVCVRLLLCGGLCLTAPLFHGGGWEQRLSGSLVLTTADPAEPSPEPSTLADTTKPSKATAGHQARDAGRAPVAPLPPCLLDNGLQELHEGRGRVGFGGVEVGERG